MERLRDPVVWHPVVQIVGRSKEAHRTSVIYVF